MTDNKYDCEENLLTTSGKLLLLVHPVFSYRSTANSD